MNKTVIIGNRIITPQGVRKGGVSIIGGKIASVGTPDAAVTERDKVIDAGDLYVSPGFIDMHTHGGGGYGFMDGTAEAVINAAKAHMLHGTTSIAPTTMACLDDDLLKSFECYNQAKAAMRAGPNLLGVHLEGPYYSEAQRGAADLKHIKRPAKEHFTRILDACGDIIRVTAAPELEGGLMLGDELKRRGILGSIGHSNAEYSQVLEAFEHGYTHIAHLYSAMSTIHREGPYRKLGVVESAYLIDGMTIEIIADGKHLPPELLRLIVRSKPLNDICLITDSMQGAGLTLGEGERMYVGSPNSKREVIIKDGVAMLSDFTAFSGSICTSDRCVRTMVKQAGVSVFDAVNMMSANPARVLGIGDKKGGLARGMDADICIFDDNINIRGVMVGGQMTVCAKALEAAREV